MKSIKMINVLVSRAIRNISMLSKKGQVEGAANEKRDRTYRSQD